MLRRFIGLVGLLVVLGVAACGPTAAAPTAVVPTPTPLPTEPMVTSPTPSPTEVCDLTPDTWVIYLVGLGESLSGVARRTGSTVPELRQLNCLTSDALTPGQKLRVPPVAPASTPTLLPRSTPIPTATPGR